MRTGKQSLLTILTPLFLSSPFLRVLLPQQEETSIINSSASLRTAGVQVGKDPAITKTK